MKSRPRRRIQMRRTDNCGEESRPAKDINAEAPNKDSAEKNDVESCAAGIIALKLIAGTNDKAFTAGAAISTESACPPQFRG